LECFAIHARILYAFLNNEKDSRNFKATDFEKTYKPISRNELSGAMQRLNSQILHFGKCRTSEPEEFTAKDADKIHRWIETAISVFLDALSPEYRSHWNKHSAEPEKLIPQTGGFRPQQFNTSFPVSLRSALGHSLCLQGSYV